MSNNRLPVLPEGWLYFVRLEGPDSHEIELSPTEGGDAYNVALRTRDGRKQTEAPTLALALKAAGETAGGIAKIEKQRAELAAKQAEVEGMFHMSEQTAPEPPKP